MSKYLDSTGLSYLWRKINEQFVPRTRTINSKPLSSNINLTASDVGAAASDHNHDETYSAVKIVRWY